MESSISFPDDTLLQLLLKLGPQYVPRADLKLMDWIHHLIPGFSGKHHLVQLHSYS